MTRKAWVTPDQQVKIVGVAMEVGDRFQTDRPLTPASYHLTPPADRAWWVCVNMFGDGYVLVEMEEEGGEA